MSPQMRLRVRVERHSLPPVRAIWPITDPSATVAQLLESLNSVFPLEGDTWGLEDYSVSLHGFDLLHYHELGTVCKDDDEIVVRPLSYRDVRTRYMTGRDQITSDGRHLVDGIPFGKPALRGPRRPELHIPPRLDSEDDTGEQVLLLTDGGAQNGPEDEYDEEEDGDFRMDDEELDEDSEEADTESEEEESSDDAASEDSSSGDSSSSDSTTGSDSSESPSLVSEESWNGLAPTSAEDTDESLEGEDSTPAAEKLPLAPKAGSPKRKRSLDEDNDLAGDTVSQHGRPSKLPKVDGLPFEGLKRTKTRNARRRDTKRLKYLIDTGVLSTASTLEDLRQYDGGQPPAEQSTTINGLQTQKKKRKDPSKTAADPSNLEARRQALLAQIADGGVDVTPESQALRSEHLEDADADDGPPQVLSSKAPSSKVTSADQLIMNGATNVSTVGSDTESSADNGASSLVVQPAARRFKLDLAGSKRLLFGSLGVRVPKTQEEKGRLQNRLAGRAGSNTLSISTGESSTTLVEGHTAPDDNVDEEDEDDVEGWRKKIRLTAVECIEEGVTLSEPPFPFYQRWDQRRKPKKSKKRKLALEAQYVETYDKYNADGNGDALDYDDPEVEESEYWEDGALLDNDPSGDDLNGEVVEDDFPPLPANVSDLPALQKDEVQVGDYVVFTELACDATTNWMPNMATRTVKIVTLTGDAEKTHQGCMVEYAKRDLAPVEYDEDGNRLYSKFEMPDEVEVEDETLPPTEKLWDNMTDMRLLLRPVAE